MEFRRASAIAVVLLWRIYASNGQMKGVSSVLANTTRRSRGISTLRSRIAVTTPRAKVLGQALDL
jgi:hypothetical protein